MKTFFKSVTDFGFKALAEAKLAPARFNTEAAQLSKGEKRFFTLFMTAAAVGNQMAFAQTGNVSGVSQAATTIKTTVFTIGQALFAVFLVVALVKVAKKFMGGEPDAMTSLFWLLGGVLVFFGFAGLKNSLVGTGNSATSADALIGQTAP